MKCTDKQCTGMQCSEAKRLFSPYLDGAVTGTQMHGLQEHLSDCKTCRQEYRLLRQTQQLLVSVVRPKVPADLSLKLRLAMSREAAQARRRPFEGLALRLESALRAFMVPATAGFLSALLIFGIAMAYFVVPSPLQASNDDVPLIMIKTAPSCSRAPLI